MARFVGTSLDEDLYLAFRNRVIALRTTNSRALMEAIRLWLEKTAQELPVRNDAGGAEESDR